MAPDTRHATGVGTLRRGGATPALTADCAEDSTALRVHNRAMIVQPLKCITEDRFPRVAALFWLDRFLIRLRRTALYWTL